MEGIVVKSTGSHYLVEGTDGKPITCRARGKLRLEGRGTTNPIAVGDRVQLQEKGAEWVISGILPRKNYIIRKATKLSSSHHIIAANIDRAWLVVTTDYPRTSSGFIDRFLVTAEAYHIPCTLLFNKSDIYDKEELSATRERMRIYEHLGYETLLISALNPADVEQLRARLQGQVNLFSGHSGVGKSTLISAIEPHLKLVTREISAAHKKGMHATTFAEMHRLSGGGYLVDTPGIKELGLVDIPREELSHYFVEMRMLLPRCRFNNCLHINEPDCAVREAVQQGEVAQSRYHSYLGMLQEEYS